MASSDYQCFILSEPVKNLSGYEQGRICWAQSFKLKKQSKKVDVIFAGSRSGVDYPVNREILQPISYEEAGLLMALPSKDRLKALDQPQGLRSARRLKEGTEVWVEEGSALLKGTIRYIGSISKPSSKWDIPGVFYGVELMGSDRGKGNTDGKYSSERFFFCDKNCGVFAAFNKITEVGVQTSPDPHSKDGSDLKPRMRLSKPEFTPDSKQDHGQPVSFVTNHFHQEPPQRETSPEFRGDSCWDSDPKPLTADPEPMDLGHHYEDPDQIRESLKGSNQSKGLYDNLRHIPDTSKTDRKDKPKERMDMIPGSAQRVTAALPESSEEDHVKSLSMPSKTRLATSRSHLKFEVGPKSLSESRAAPLTRSGPESPEVLGTTETEDMYGDPKGAPKFAESKTNCSRSVSKPEGPKPGLENVSTVIPEAGERVHFLCENGEVLEGNVVYVENAVEGTVVHIAGTSGTLIVPLGYVLMPEMKTAPPDTEDLYMDPEPTVPRVDRKEDCSSPGLGSVAPPMASREDCTSLGVDSVVEIDLSNGVKGFGTIRWVGFLPGVQHKMAGLELEDERGNGDGCFRGHRFFSCPERHALFVKLSSCRPDSRFYRKEPSNQRVVHQRESTNHSGPKDRANYNGFPTLQNVDSPDDFDLEPVPPIAADDVEHLLIGRMKGIQGHHNSCYMDSALFSLFSVSSVLDSLLFKTTSPPDTNVQKILLRDIVNPLRRRGFVEGCHVMNLRKQLQKHGFSHSFTTDEKDPEEFLTVIMQHILNLDPLIKLCSGGKVQDSFCFQIFLDNHQDLVLPTVQQLVEHSFHSNGLKLSEVPSCLILQMPRFGKKFKMFDKILPSLELDVTDLLQKGLKQCMLCGGAAQWECDDCFLDAVFGPNGLKLFCDQCNRQVHRHARRRGHRSKCLDTSLRDNGDSFHGKRDKLHLLAVLCIETSHYVSFVKYGPEPQHWLFFDSMADRVGEADGFNVPQVSVAPELSQYLNMSLSELANQTPREMKGVAKRLLCDAYLYVYQSPALRLYT